MRNFWVKFYELLPVVLLAVGGGFCRTVAAKKRGESYSWKIALPELILAGFAGLLMHWCLSDTDIGENLRSVAVALAGYSARPIIGVINALFIDGIKKNLPGGKSMMLIGTLAGTLALAGIATGCGMLAVETAAPKPEQEDKTLAVELIAKHADAIDRVKDKVASDLELAYKVREAVAETDTHETVKTDGDVPWKVLILAIVSGLALTWIGVKIGRFSR